MWIFLLNIFEWARNLIYENKTQKLHFKSCSLNKYCLRTFWESFLTEFCWLSYNFFNYFLQIQLHLIYLILIFCKIYQCLGFVMLIRIISYVLASVNLQVSNWNFYKSTMVVSSILMEVFYRSVHFVDTLVSWIIKIISIYQ